MKSKNRHRNLGLTSASFPSIHPNSSFYPSCYFGRFFNFRHVNMFMWYVQHKRNGWRSVSLGIAWPWQEADRLCCYSVNHAMQAVDRFCLWQSTMPIRGLIEAWCKATQQNFFSIFKFINSYANFGYLCDIFSWAHEHIHILPNLFTLALQISKLKM